MKGNLKIAGTLLLMAVLFSCKHDPFPGQPPGLPFDTVNIPVDTTDPNGSTGSTKPCDPDTVYFYRDIMPIISSSCAYAGCHDAVTRADKIDLTTYNSIIDDGDIDPLNPDGSKLYKAITDSDPNERMPKNQAPLPADQIALIRKWILQGAQNLSCDECDTVNVAFNADIEPIFKTSCQSCHNAAVANGNLNLVGYQNIKDAIVMGEVLQRINHVPGFNPMPQSGIKLEECKLAKIDKWVSEGLPNN